MALPKLYALTLALQPLGAGPDEALEAALGKIGAARHVIEARRQMRRFEIGFDAMRWRKTASQLP